MELRRLAMCMAFFVLAVSQCSEAHSMRRRQVIDDNYDDNILSDDAGDDDTQNDTDNGEYQPQPVKVAATIETVSQTYEVKAGERLQLECKVKPEETTVVQWFKNNEPYFMGNVPLHQDTRYSIVSNSKDLLIDNVEATDSGVFRCETIQSSPVSVNHTVIVTQKPLVVNMTATNDGIVGEGTELTLTCDVTGSPLPTVIWSVTKEGSNARLSEKHGCEFESLGGRNFLKIKSVKAEQAGEYFCYAFNKIGNHQAAKLVIVNHKPQVHVSKTAVNSDLQIEAVLQCSAHETQRAHIRWYKDNLLIEDSSSNYQISTNGAHSNLTVVPNKDSDFGTFTCEAENEYGTHNKSIELVQWPVVEDFGVDGTKLSWTVSSHQPVQEMEVQLTAFNENDGNNVMRIPVPVPTGQGHKFDVTYALEDKQLEAGQYEAIVKVKNSKDWGGSAEPIIVKIEAQPQYIQHASVFRENAHDNAHSIRPAYTVFCTVLMYLLVRML